jgi:hypothetical protein
MSWHAVDALDDAVDATRRFLFPFGLVRWTKIALLVLFMGSGGASTNASVPAVSDSSVRPSSPVEPGSVGTGGGGIGSGSGVSGQILHALDSELMALVALGIVLLVVAVSVVSLSLRLVFYDALQTNEVRVVGPFLSRLRQALGLFVFTAAVGVAAAAPIALAVAVAVVADAPTGWSVIDSVAAAIASSSTGAIVALGLVGAGLVAVAVLALRFTYEFVVPTMVVEEVGVIGGWRRFLSTLRADPTEFLIYLVVHLVVSIGLSVVVGAATVLGFAFVATVGGLVLLLVAALLGGLGALVGTSAGAAALAIVTIAGIGGLLVLVLPVLVATRSYRIIYEVSTLGGVDPGLTLLHPDLDPGTDGSERSAAADATDR